MSIPAFSIVIVVLSLVHDVHNTSNHVANRRLLIGEVGHVDDDGRRGEAGLDGGQERNK